MKILQTIPYMLASHGGPSTCTCDLMDGLYDETSHRNIEVDLLSSYPRGNTESVLGINRPWMKSVECDYRTPLAMSKNIDEYLKESNYDLYHANTLWLYPTHATCKQAINNGKKYVLSPHGMLYPTALSVSAWKKKLMGALWYRSDVMHAACLHATCIQEMEHCRSYGYKGPIAVIPNPVVFPEYIQVFRRTIDSFMPQNGKRYIGFLGRLHPIKKVENLIYALDKLPVEQQSQVSLQIMGKFDDQYEQWLKDEVKRLHLEDCVEFVGYVNGKDKYDRLSQLSALMVPSAQENFGMIVPEALICGTPVYASLGTPWNELNELGCGWWKENDPTVIADVIRDILSKSEVELLEMGKRGRLLMEEKYEQHKVAQMMIELYRWMLEGGDKPVFVYE